MASKVIQSLNTVNFFIWDKRHEFDFNKIHPGDVLLEIENEKGSMMYVEEGYFGGINMIGLSADNVDDWTKVPKIRRIAKSGGKIDIKIVTVGDPTPDNRAWATDYCRLLQQTLADSFTKKEQS